MGRTIAPESKIAWGRDEPISEGPLPEAVGDYPIGERVVLMSNPIGQSEATVGFCSIDVRQVRVEHLQGGQGARCERITYRTFRFPSFMDTNGLHRLGLDHAIKFRRRTQVFKLSPEFPNRVPQFCDAGKFLRFCVLGRCWRNYWVSKTNLIHRIAIFPVGRNEGKELTVCGNRQIDCLKSICSGDFFKGLIDLPINYDPGTGSKICAGSEITDLCRETEFSLTKGFSEGIQGEGDPRVCVNAKQGLVGILEIDPSQFGGMLAGHGPVSNHVPGITGCLRQAGDAQTGRTDRDLGRASFAIRNKNTIDKIKRRWIKFVGYDIPQGSEIPGLYFGTSRVKAMSLGSIARTVSSANDIGQTESVA